MEFEKVKTKFGSWADVFRDFIESAEFDAIFAELIALKRRNRVSCPASNQTFKAFELTPYEKLKTVFIIDGPPAIVNNSVYLADGIALSCSNTDRIDTPLFQFYRSMESDLNSGLNLEMVDCPDLSYLCRQGVLLLYSALTCEQNKPGSHQQLWKPFYQYLFNEVINNYDANLPIVFAGPLSRAYSNLAVPFHHIVFELDKPGVTPGTGSWDSKNVFKIIDEILSSNELEKIKWYNERQEN